MMTSPRRSPLRDPEKPLPTAPATGVSLARPEGGSTMMTSPRRSPLRDPDKPVPSAPAIGVSLARPQGGSTMMTSPRRSPLRDPEKPVPAAPPFEASSRRQSPGVSLARPERGSTMTTSPRRSPLRDPEKPVPAAPPFEASSRPQSPAPEVALPLTHIQSPPPPDGSAGESGSPSMAIVIVNKLDKEDGPQPQDVIGSGGRTKERGQRVEPRSGRRPQGPRRAAGWLRAAALVLCMIAFSLMTSDKTEGWAGDSFDRYREFRYLVAVNVIGFVYSIFQVYARIHQRVTMKYMMHRRMRYLCDLSMDQTLAYLLMSASSAAASRNDVWVSRFGSDAFTDKANGAVAVSFLAFIVLAISSIISAYNFFRWSF